MTFFKSKLSTLPAKTLYFLRNIVGIYVILFVILLVMFANPQNIGPRFMLIVTIVTPLMPIIYALFAKTLDKAIYYLLSEKLDFQKYDAYWNCHLSSKWGGRAVAYYALGVSAFYQGQFEDSIQFFDKVNKERQSKALNAKLSVLIPRYYLQALYFRGNKHFSEASLYLDNSAPYLDCLVDILYLGKPSDDILKWPSKTRLDIIHLTYLKAKNDLLLGQTDSAIRELERLSQESSKVFFAREASCLLKELRKDELN